MNFYRARRQAGEYIEGVVSGLNIERVIQGTGHACLLGATAFAALGFFESGALSDEETTEILTCADDLDSMPTKLYDTDNCENFTDKFEEFDGYADYLAPSRDVFIREEMWTSQVDEKRAEDFTYSFGLLWSSLSMYGFVAFRRRLNNPEPSTISYEAEEWLRSQSGQ